jgi:hypothetical protein
MDISPRDLAINANFEMSYILESAIEHLERKRSLDLSASEKLLSRLRSWSNALPHELRRFSARSLLRPGEHEMVVGNLHIACIYYFAVILITRPFLITSLLMRLPSSPTRHAGMAYGEVSPLAEVCIDSAVFMARICRDALAAGLVLENMCLLK